MERDSRGRFLSKNEHSIKKGQKLRAGKRKINLTKTLKDILKEDVEGMDGVTKAEEVMRSLVKLATQKGKKQLEAIKLLLEYTARKPTTSVDINTKGTDHGQFVKTLNAEYTEYTEQENHKESKKSSSE